MPSRRSHTNSHHGCSLCKRRRVKCDEARPQCAPCRRRHLACTYLNESPTVSHSPETGPTTSTSCGPTTLSSNLPLLELELLSHWHTATSLSLELDKSRDDLLRRAVSQLAVSFPFLMHGLLSFSAFHLAWSCQSNRRHIYADAALKQKQSALSQFAPMLDNITEENCNASFSFSFLLVNISFASQSLDITRTVKSIDGVVETFKLIRGVAAVVDHARKWIEKGELASVLRKGQFDKPQPEPKSVIHSRLQKLLELCQTVSDGFAPIRLAAVEKLVEIYNSCTAISDDVPILAWPVSVEMKFLDLLVERDQVSLVILAYYGALLDKLKRVW